jgi:hypothetical protein
VVAVVLIAFISNHHVGPDLAVEVFLLEAETLT